jgi:hypothetical protein
VLQGQRNLVERMVESMISLTTTFDGFKYFEGEKVICVSVTEDNHEGLELGEIYTVIGKSEHDGNQLYAVRNSRGDIIYTIDRFERVTFNHDINEIRERGINVVEKDMINPDHYKTGGIETIDYMEAKLTPEEYRGYLRGNIIKYTSRAGYKDDVLQEYKKVEWYLNRLIKHLEGADKPVKVENVDDLAPITKKQRGYIAGLATQLGFDRTNLPKWLSPVADYHDLTEVEAIDVIEKLLTIQNDRRER